MTAELKKQIDEMSYEAMLSHCRFAPAGNIMFQGDIGDYFVAVMASKRKQISQTEQVVISKRIGWRRTN
jgi:hypothetical protein